MTQTRQELEFTKKLHKNFKAYYKRQRDVWESYQIIDFYTPEIHKRVKSNTLNTLSYEHLWSDQKHSMSKDDVFGALSSLNKKYNSRRSLIEAVLIYEDYMASLVYSSFKFFPNRLLNPRNVNLSERLMRDIVGTTNIGTLKHAITVAPYNVRDTSTFNSLKDWITTSSTHAELMDLVIDSKLLQIFFGKPSLILTTGKTKLNIDHGMNTHNGLITQLEYIVGVRNIISHNDGKISYKFIQEVDPTETLGRNFIVTRDFLKSSIQTLTTLSALATSYYIENNLNGNIDGKLLRVLS